MEVMPMTHARPDLGRRPRNGAEGDEETQDMDCEAAAGDLYGMLGYRALYPGHHHTALAGLPPD